jgi:hypothetical protein
MTEDNIRFVLSHFTGQEFLFPRSIMTAKTNGQVFVDSEDEIRKYFSDADYLDCRINAYPEILERDGFLVQPPNFVFIDLDISNFSNDIRKLDKIKNSTLRKMEQLNGSHPTVTLRGNGYHIYLPIDIPVLDNEYVFSKDKFPNLFSSKSKYSHYYVSEVFMQFAEDYFTGEKSDPNHRPKYKTCLIRIPETYNSKCLNKGLSLEESKVKILQKWDEKRVNVESLVQEFRIWLTLQEINLSKDKSKKNTIKKPQYEYSSNRNNQSGNVSRIDWIEKLLKTPIEDQRKDCLWRIIGPYLLNVKNLSESETSKIMEEWLEKCDKFRKLDFEPRIKIYSIIKGNKGYKPISFSKLKEENKDLFVLLDSQTNIKKEIT